MAFPKAYVSFDIDHNNYEKIIFTGQVKISKTPINIVDWSSKARFPQREWDKLVEAKIKKCNVLIVLVGAFKDTATISVKEIEFAKKNNVPVFGIYVGDANRSSILPLGLKRKRTLIYKLNKLDFAIEQVMKEGKNKKGFLEE